MKNIKYIILGLILVSSAANIAHAKDPSVPELDVSGDDSSLDEKSLDPLLEVSAPGEPAKPAAQNNSIAAPNPLLSGNTAETGEKKKILDKAIKEVFEEPKKDNTDAPAAKPEEKVVEKAPEAKTPDAFDNVEVTATGSSDKVKPAEAPKVDEATDPLNIDNSVEDLKMPDDLKDADNKPAVEVKAADKKAVDTKPAEVPVKAATEVKPIEVAPAIPAVVIPVAEAPKKEEKAPAKPEVKAAAKKEVRPETKVNVASEKVKKEKPKAKASKKPALPKATPKSLREDYLEPHAPGSVEAAPISAPMATPANFPAGTKPIQEMETAPIFAPIVPVVTPAAKAPSVPVKKAPASLKQGSKADDLDAIQEFPSKKKALNVKSDISIDRGGFSDPFVGKGNTPAPAAAATPNEPADALAEAPYTKEDAKADSNSTTETPVVDFSDNAQDISALKGNTSTAPAKPQNFYMQDAGLEMEVKEAPKNSIGAMKNGYEALQVGQYESAIKYYNEALEQNPDNEKALFGIATAYHMSKDYEKAKDAYLKIINRDPNYWPAVNNYIILVTEENPEKSIGRLEELYAKNPSFAAIPAQLGNLYYKKGDTQKAVDFYSSAVKLEPKNVEYRYNLALILEKTSRKQDAAELYRSLLDDAAQGTKLPENPSTIKDRYDQLLSKQS